MKYDKAGEYTLTYKATDECGNETTATRQIVVEEPEEQWMTIIDISDYVAPNSTPIQLVNMWDEDVWGEDDFIVEMENAVADGTAPVTWDGRIPDLGRTMLSIGIDSNGVYESGVNVSFNLNDDGEVVTYVGSDGPGDYVPRQISFGKLVIKQKVK